MQGDAVEIEDADWRGRGHVEVPWIRQVGCQ